MSKSGIYSEDSPEPAASIPTARFYSKYQTYAHYPPMEPRFGSDLLSTYLHTTIEQFHSILDGQKLLRKCLVSENPQCAAKLSLCQNKLLQAFDLTLQVYCRICNKSCARVVHYYTLYIY